MKKIKIAALLLAAAAAFSGCAADYSDIVGYDYVKNAKTLYTSLNSGHLQITDNSSGTVTQDFVFAYNSKGALVYSYMGTDGETTYYEYHNGEEINYCYADSTEWSFVDAANESYYSYDRSSRHPLTAETAINLSPESITDGQLLDRPDGTRQLIYYYDCASLSSYSASLSEVGTLTGFQAIIELDADGYCTSVTQIGTLTDDEGEMTVDYTMTISDMNEVTAVDRPVMAWE